MTMPKIASDPQPEIPQKAPGMSQMGTTGTMNNQSTSLPLISASAATIAPTQIIAHPGQVIEQALSVREMPAVLSEEQKALALSVQWRIPLVKLVALIIDPEALKFISEEKARKYKVLPVKVEHGDAASLTTSRPLLVIAMENPGDLQAIAQLEFSSGCKIGTLVATSSEIHDAIERYYAPERLLQDLLRNIADVQEIRVVEYDAEPSVAERDPKEAPAVKLVNLILQQAIKKGASDIHLEPTMYELKVRLRISGILREFTTLPRWLLEPITSRIKIMAKLNITERRRPQDGRIKILFEDRDIDVRISTMPAHFGEKTVMRVLGTSETLPETRNLGLRPQDLEILKRVANQPQGMIVVTGPTGSGKTTTLYSIINEKKAPSLNIVTIEDPIEIQLNGLNQVQVNAATGMTFASCMRSLLRQDPDVILLGEIRDSETQEIALQAAQTGHLVMTSLHANNTTAAVGRLLDLGSEPYVVADAIRLVVAQRLIRKICSQCTEMYEPSAELVRQLGLSRHDKSFVRGKGCKACGLSGYESRFAIFELLPMSPAIKELIARRAPEMELRRAAVAAGMGTLLEQAVQYVRDGVTTCEEVARVVETQMEEKDQRGLRCPQCSAAIELAFVRCPSCLLELKASCHSCHQNLESTWPVCPYCGTAKLSMAKLEVKKERVASTIGFAAVSDRQPLSAQLQPAKDTPKNAVSDREPFSPQLQSAKDTGKKKILIVDDVELNRLIARKALEKLPFAPEVLEAKDGFEALQLVKSEKPDLIVLDLMMPGMSGFEVCRTLREDVETAFIPIIMLTASATEESRIEGYVTGTDDYMTKPFSVPDLHARVIRLFRRTYGI